jgi:sulfopyruvate decarboxylase TPP-binding subunit
MLDTDVFIEHLIDQGYTHLCVVPCSFVKYLINASINYNSRIEYLPCASEAIACSIAAGLRISGKNPIVIAQSSGLTNMGSCITSLLKPYEIYFPIIVSWRTYNEGDSEIQHKHLARKLPELIEAYGYQYEILDKYNLDLAIQQIKKCEKTSQICILEKDTFSEVDLLLKHQLELSHYPKRSAYLSLLNDKYESKDTLFIGTTGNTAREMNTFMPDTCNFYMAGNMGGALSVGLGAAKAGKRVVVCGGDAEFVMHLGGITTAGRYNTEIDLTYILFDNESNKSTGGQNTYQDHIDYNLLAKYSGFLDEYSVIHELSYFEEVIDQNISDNGTRIIIVKCSYDSEVPRPPLDVIKRNKL